MAKLEWNGTVVLRGVEQAAKSGVRAAAELVREVAVNRAPVETGALRNSAKVSQEGTDAVVSFNTKYAARQHEELGWHHQDGQAKYLESALLDSQADVQDAIAKEIRKAL